MNTTIQNILVFIAIGLAIGYLVKKFFWKKKSSSKACSSDKNCTCH